MAEGVLLVLLGHATKISGHLLTDGEKIYSGTLRLGQETDTWDAEGKLIAQHSYEHITTSQVHEFMQSWLGSTEQIVPPYSAAKHKGQPLYKLARAGLQTPVKKKTINISQMEVLDISFPFVRFRVKCSSGTYIRSLAHSLGKRLGCSAILTELTREYSHPFNLDQAHTLDAILAQPHRLHEWIMPITKTLPHWPVLTLTAQEEAMLKNGHPLEYDEGRECWLDNATKGIGNLLLEAWQAENQKAILISQSGMALALAQVKIVNAMSNTSKKNLSRPMWTILRGLWTSD